MKVYVDELPKKCEDCVFSETGFVWDDEVRFCKLKPRCMNWIALYDEKRKDCPLQSLADHDKQVIEKFINIIDDKFNVLGYVEEKFEDIKKYVLDQIQGENNVKD